MSEIVFPLATLQNAARSRPEGYLEDILAVSRIDEETDNVYIPADQFVALRSKYSPERDKESTLSLEDELNKYKKDGLTLVSDAEFEQRFQKCLMCPFWDNRAYNNTGKCKICNCRTQVNLRITPSYCPLGYW